MVVPSIGGVRMSSTFPSHAHRLVAEIMSRDSSTRSVLMHALVKQYFACVARFLISESNHNRPHPHHILLYSAFFSMRSDARALYKNASSSNSFARLFTTTFRQKVCILRTASRRFAPASRLSSTPSPISSSNPVAADQNTSLSRDASELLCVFCMLCLLALALPQKCLEDGLSFGLIEKNIKNSNYL